MAAVSVYLDTRRAKKDGTFPLKFNISINRGVSFLINLKIDLLPEQWDAEKEKIADHNNKKLFNDYILQKHANIKKELDAMEVQGLLYTLTPEKIKQRIESVFCRSGTSNSTYTVKDHWEYFLTFKDRRATQESYTQTLLKIGTFVDLNTLTFNQITPIWLRDFELHMKNQNLAINSIGIHMRNIRSVFNDVINTDRINQDSYPFRKYKIKSEKTAKRSMSINELQMFRDYPVQEHQKKYQDLFMLIFYMEGINIVDLLHLKTLNDGRADFKRSKTGRLYSIKIEPEAQLIIDKYKGKKYLLDVLDTYSNYRDFHHRMNSNLQSIGRVEMIDNAAIHKKDIKKNKKKVTPLFPELTTYWARHTWATIAASLDIPKETIAAALGHGGNSVTDIYIDFDRKKIDTANRLVIDAINTKQDIITFPAAPQPQD